MSVHEVNQLIFTCDRCGRGGPLSECTTTSVHVRISAPYSGDSTTELCSRCGTEFNQWLENWMREKERQQ